MAVESTMLDLGTPAPGIHLPDVASGETVSSNDYAGKPLLVMFICRHCPYVKHVEGELARLGRDYEGKVGIIAVGSNDAEAYPGDKPERLKAQAERAEFGFPYTYDESQEVAKAYTAACTPDFFLFDDKHALAYRGRLDSSRPKSETPVTGEDLRAALDAVLAGKRPSEEQYPSAGCNVKWKPGNEPDYFS